ncbi:Na+/H+ antiporter subunit E [Prosthecochloris sp. N3]|uniref:Na+/H+ antiporter subunit E n=1 Tax=Prosthecochloris ethylica TaxID=2743976 RepID=A0ABR9XSM7_9CHLB|nr:Na+/H+ antiporter subunit E [Prosthecochloris ethylica]MBF0585954.1 Na+/H+ antiporter subunit E [Prosthecochloris ethylica]MBF0637041.1 Na+/H+ antiporter subunit E [Prosthecochloris ethylica]NUK47278.1 Na+/H+ antiporter subunit E [Prosthecochloris ethylica]
MNPFLFNILLAIAWMLLVGEVSASTFTAGLVVGYLLLWLSRAAWGETRYFSKIPLVVRFVLYFLKELLIANLKVAFDIVTPKDYMEPGIIAVPLDVETDIEITLFANLVTLTPGTLSLDVSADRTTLYVHALYVKDVDRFRHELKNGLEQRLIEVMR